MPDDHRLPPEQRLAVFLDFYEFHLRYRAELNPANPASNKSTGTRNRRSPLVRGNRDRRTVDANTVSKSYQLLP